MSRSTSASSAAQSTTVNLSRSASVKASFASGKPSNTSLFLTNLRLLDLDLRDDWPAITAQTFSTHNAQQNQKNRIRCVEWALFRLFELWDPEETREKLQPFFPPLEPLQSLNLRAALYRCLSELKKNGVLGRESVLRKTMLDECKGDKLMELLLVFSTAVLKKTIAPRVVHGSQKETAVKALATAASLSISQQNSLLPLAIAHRATLKAVLENKQVQRSRYVKFSQLLDAKSEDISERIEKCREEKHSGRNSSKNVDIGSIKRQLRENWTGNAKWLDAMLYGDDEKSDNIFLQKPFGDIWHRVEKGGTLEGQGIQAGLLESLEARVKQQQSRIDRWQEFHDELNKSNPPSPRAKESLAGTEAAPPVCAFDTHVDLQLGESKIMNEAVTKSTRTSQTYQGIISDMNDELSKASRLRRDRVAISHARERRGSAQTSKSPIRRTESRSNSAPKKSLPQAVAEAKPAAKPAPKKQTFDKVPALARKFDTLSTPVDSEATLIGSTRETLPSLPPTQARPILPRPRRNENGGIPPTFVPPTQPLAPPRSQSPELLPELFVSKEEQLAEQIISSIDSATPSPVKKPRPSLTERARMSMAHASAFQIPETVEESPPSSLPPLPDFPQETLLDRRQTLAERTRQSMSRVSLAPQLKPSRKEREAKRQSMFPVNQFDTPRKQVPIEEKKGDSTPKEYLFSEKADYDNVFKSRPKIAQSPVLSPENEEEDGELPMDSILDLDVDDSGLQDTWESSPLRGRLGVGERGRV